jgi:cell division protein FtsW (lipid II flippase)
MMDTAPVQVTGSQHNRQLERLLLLLAGAFLFVNFLALILVRGSGALAEWVHFVAWAACAFTAYRLLNQRLSGHDPLLLPLTLFLSGWGMVMIDRLAPNFADRQTVWLVLSVAAMLTVALLPQPLRWLRNYRYILLVVGLALLVSTILLGRNPSDPLAQTEAPQLWLGFGSIYFQPSEALKIILVGFLASYLAEQYPAMRAEGIQSGGFSPRVFGPILLMWGLSVVILIWQRDLGTAALFFVVFLVLLYIASANRYILTAGLVLLIIAAVVGYQRFSVVRLRVDVWVNPWPEADSRAFQIVQSLLAFAAGGPFGQGVGQGQPTFIPVVHSDFVFAALAEEWGLLGIVAAIACIATLVMRGLQAAVRQGGRPFPALLGVGLSMLIATQSLLIMAGTLKLIPLTGVTLPYMSYGGSSLLASFIIVGLLLRLSALEN